MRNFEIERKFLVDETKLPDLSKINYMDIIQGYIYHINENFVFRLRQVLHMGYEGNLLGEDFYQTIKGSGLKVRKEHEAKIWKNTFSTFWPLCENIQIHKLRYILPTKANDHVIHLDIYKNDLKGLITAEVEFKSETDCDEYEPEDWFLTEVTHDPRYANVNLALNGLPKD